MNKLLTIIKVVTVAATVFCLGCEMPLFNKRATVKRRIQAHARAISEEDWEKAVSYYHPRMKWTRNGETVQGRKAVLGFLSSIREVRGRNDFYTEVHRAKLLDEKRVAASVTFTIHIVESAMALQFSSRNWRADMLWVETARNEWKIAVIKEVSQRTRGRVSTAGT